MKKAKGAAAPAATVELTPRQLEIASHGLKIWRQVVVASTFLELRDGSPIPYQEALTEIDLTLEKFEQAKGK